MPTFSWETLPRSATIVTTRHGRAAVLLSMDDLPEALRNRLLADRCQDHRYYALLEATLTDGFDYRYALLEEAGTGALAIQPFFLVDQDITAGLPVALRQPVGKLRAFFPRALKLKILMVGCTAGEGQLDSGEPWAVEALAELVEKYARQVRAKLILFKDFPASYREALTPLLSHGYCRAPSMPGATMALGFADFDDYMSQRLSRIYRKGLRRKFRDSERHGKLEMEVVVDATPFVAEIHALYLQTHHRSHLKFEELTAAYLSELGRRMPDRVRFFLWRLEGRIVAFALCMVHDGTLYDLNLGLDYEVALDLHLYFITWRDLVSWAFKQGLQRYATGPLNYDPKLHLRLDLAPLDLWARHLSPLINPIFGRVMPYLQPTRHDPVLARFANADEL